MARADREQTNPETQALRDANAQLVTANEAWRARCADLEAELASLKSAHLPTREYLFAPAELVAPPHPGAGATTQERTAHEAACVEVRGELLKRSVRIRAAVQPPPPQGCTFRGVVPGSEQVSGRPKSDGSERIHLLEAPNREQYRERAASATDAARAVAARLGLRPEDLRWRGCTAA